MWQAGVVRAGFKSRVYCKGENERVANMVLVAMCPQKSRNPKGLTPANRSAKGIRPRGEP